MNMLCHKLLRVMAFVDGFNLYHSIESIQRERPGVALKWLNLQSLLSAHLYMLDSSARLVGVHYFTAYADHLAGHQQQKVLRHKAYVRALTASGVVAHFGKFKAKQAWIESLQGYHRLWQEKATDVGIVAELFRQAHLNAFDVAVLVSGDADYAPAVSVFGEIHPAKRLVFAFPHDRKNRELDRLTPGSFTLGKEAYAQHQLPQAVRLPSGKHVVCPSAWRATPPSPPDS